MRKQSHTSISNTRFSSGASVEKRLKIFAVIILAACIVSLIVTRGSLQEFLNFLSK
jgi:hypothetical protein